MARRPQTKLGTYATFRREELCGCGCMLVVKGRKLFATPACRKRRQRLLDKIERILGPGWTREKIGNHNAHLDALRNAGKIDPAHYLREFITVLP